MKYFAVTRTTSMASLMYERDVVLRSIFMVVVLVIFVQLWSTTFQQAQQQRFAGFELRAHGGLRPVYWQLAIAGGIDLILLFLATVIGSTPLILVTGGLASVILGPAFWAMTGRLLSTER